MFGIARDLGGITALPAAAKYQLIASFVILVTAGIIHNKQPAVRSEWSGELVNDRRAVQAFGAAGWPDSRQAPPRSRGERVANYGFFCSSRG
jgi:hypothetical protein